MSKFKNKYRIETTRLRKWDYGSNGCYFITICTKNMVRYFGDIVCATPGLSALSALPALPAVQTQNIASLSLPHLPHLPPLPPLPSLPFLPNMPYLPYQPIQKIQTPEYLQNPDGWRRKKIIAYLRPTIIGKIANQYWLEIPEHFPFVELDEYIVMPNHVHGILFINKIGNHEWTTNKFGPQSQNLGSIIRGYKAGVKAYATTNKIDFKWQPRFHDSIIRSEADLNRVRQYIRNNPMKWYQKS